MKLFIVRGLVAYEGGDPIGVFSTRELAIQFAKTVASEYDGVDIGEFELNKHSDDWLFSDIDDEEMTAKEHEEARDAFQD